MTYGSPTSHMHTRVEILVKHAAVSSPWWSDGRPVTHATSAWPYARTSEAHSASVRAVAAASLSSPRRSTALAASLRRMAELVVAVAVAVAVAVVVVVAVAAMVTDHRQAGLP